MGGKDNSQVFLFPKKTRPQQRNVPRRLMVSNHLTNSNAVVDVFRTDYSDVVRSYCVRCRGPLDLHVPPILWSVTLNDMVLLAVFVVLALPSLPMLFECFFVNGFLPPVGNQDDESNKSSIFLFSLRPVLVALSSFILLYRFVNGVRRVHVEEVTAIRGLGMQLTNYNVFGGILSQRFFDLKLIRSLIVYDAYFRCRVIFFLSAAIENSAERVVLFEETLPRLAVLQPILCGLRHILYEEPESGPTLAEIETSRSDRLEESAVCEYKIGMDDSDITEYEFDTSIDEDSPLPEVELQEQNEAGVAEAAIK